MNRTSVAAGVLLTSVLVALPAAADLTKAECIGANTKAQSLRREGKLREARVSLLSCASDSCPAVLREDCVQRLDELERAAPTILFEVKDGAGHDMSQVRVTLDGAPFLDKVTAGAVLVDPGEHDFSFSAEGKPPVTQHVVIREGDKSRRLSVTIGPVEPVVTRKPSAIDLSLTPARTPDTKESKGRLPTWAWITGGALVVAGLVVGGYFLFRPAPDPGSRPMGSLGTVQLPASFAWGR
jgi:hypothetical protein